MTKISEIFDVETGRDLTISKEPIGDIPVVSLCTKNNGIVKYIKENPLHKLHKAGSITVGAYGTLYATVQFSDFYVAGRVKVLTSKRKMTIQEKLYYCVCINRNRYRFNYGRVAGERIAELDVPETVPKWTDKIELPDYNLTVDNEITDVADRLIEVRSWKIKIVQNLYHQD